MTWVGAGKDVHPLRGPCSSAWPEGERRRFPAGSAGAPASFSAARGAGEVSASCATGQGRPQASSSRTGPAAKASPCERRRRHHKPGACAGVFGRRDAIVLLAGVDELGWRLAGGRSRAPDRRLTLLPSHPPVVKNAAFQKYSRLDQSLSLASCGWGPACSSTSRAARAWTQPLPLAVRRPRRPARRRRRRALRAGTPGAHPYQFVDVARVRRPASRRRTARLMRRRSRRRVLARAFVAHRHRQSCGDVISDVVQRLGESESTAPQ